MVLTRYLARNTSHWAIDGRLAGSDVPALRLLLSMERTEMMDLLASQTIGSRAPDGELQSPAETFQEVWAAGVTYLRSRVEREAESTAADIYGKVYVADRPELFFKSAGRRTVAHGGNIRIRRDSSWNVPEPELTLVVNRYGQVVGYTAGNDVSSRSIEGENPLYLPQAKTYDGSCALGPGIVLATADDLRDIAISLTIRRGADIVFEGEASTSQMKRSFEDLVDYLFRENTFEHGVFLMTGTGIVPTQDFTLLPGDDVQITVGELTLINTVADIG